ncbi:NUDIX hydrolase [Pendulispora albinea]|uniref:NUDIX domain-containing protein n=1 Tax=Pendulispora albinea TaxID=2741071 RepID=A0ABZ2MC91_9BACT
MMAAGTLLDVLHGYAARFPERASALDPLRALIADGASVTSRHEPRGHVTVGAAVLDPEGRLLVVRHRALGRWLMPGGHLEPGDRTLLDAALRELLEETGISPEQVRVPALWREVPIHIDCHVIPANPRKGEPEHAHWDFRFLFEMVGTERSMVLQTEEVLDARWLAPDAHSEIVAAVIRAALKDDPRARPAR